MADNKYYEIDLDIWGKDFPKEIVTKQLDTGRKIKVNLFSNGYIYDVSNSKVTIYMKKNNKKIIFNDCKVIEKNVIELELTSAMVDEAGEFYIEIDIMSDGISTFIFKLIVEETIKDTIQITQSSEYKALVELFKEINKRKEPMDNYLREESKLLKLHTHKLIYGGEF